MHFTAAVAEIQRDEPAGLISTCERLGAPAGPSALLVGDDPDLEDAGGAILEIVFAVPDAAPGGHHLDVARFGAAFVAKVVAMGDRAFANVGDDFHVAVGTGGKPVPASIVSSFQTRRLPQLSRAG